MTTRRGEHPVLPPVVAAERAKIQLFLTYLSQQTTQEVLHAAARGDDRYKAIDHLVSSLRRYRARNLTELRELLTVAPAFKAVCDFAGRVNWQVRPSMMPMDAFPSDECLEAAVVAYHAWVGAQAKRRK